MLDRLPVPKIVDIRDGVATYDAAARKLPRLDLRGLTHSEQRLRRRSAEDAVAEVRDAGRVDDPRELELDVVGAEVVEQPPALAEQHGDHVELDLVEHAGAERLCAASAPCIITSRSPAAALACAAADSMPSVT